MSMKYMKFLVKYIQHYINYMKFLYIAGIDYENLNKKDILLKS